SKRLLVSKKNFDFFFPDLNIEYFDILKSIDDLVKERPSVGGFGINGPFIYSENPILMNKKYKIEDFIIDEEKYIEDFNNSKLKLRLNTPIAIVAVFTNKCSTNCIYCYAPKKKTKEMSLDKWGSIIQEMKELNIERIILDNGDIGFREDKIDFLELLLKHDMIFSISTKGYFSDYEVSRLIDNGYCKLINNSIKRNVQLSIDAIDDDILSFMTKNINFKSEIIETYKNFYKRGIIPKIKAVLTPYNIKQIPKIVDFFYDIGARKFEFVKYMRSFYRHNDNLFLSNDHIKIIDNHINNIIIKYPEIEIHCDIRTKQLYFPDIDPNNKLELWKNRSGCSGGWTTLGIAADGSAFLCEQAPLIEDFIVGNLKENSIKEIWDSDRLKKFIFTDKNKFSGTVCYECHEFEECHWSIGYCYRDSYFSYGTKYDAPPMCPMQSKPGLRLT
ncbi:radical SAM protein, partial [Bacteroidota bacterium]